MRQSGAKHKKQTKKKQPFNSCGRRGKPPVSISSANYGSFSSPGAGRAPPPQPPLKKKGEGPIIIIITTITITTIITTFTLPL